jgi:nitrite reductase/ring-hydroxylating ferredoxin subunit
VEWVDVAGTHDIEKGKMILVEIERKKVVIANVGGAFNAFNDRCPHSNAPLHLGTLHGEVLTCALHFSSFDVTTGKKLSDPRELDVPTEIIQKMPANFLQMEQKLAEIRR